VNFPALLIFQRLIRSLAQKDHALSNNLLSAIAEQAQIYLRQLDQLNLKSVPQRVGNFVLRQFLSDSKREKAITLPYDKSMIAAYLGMQPESFSRALSHLRKEGIDIDKDCITLPHLFALCGYCDIDTAQNCASHGTPECPNPQCGG
jgi:CRP-like cAMP-binding protein